MLSDGNLRLGKLPGGGGMEGRTEGRKDGRMEIHPCVLQDIGPLGPLPKKDQEYLQCGAISKRWTEIN